jgi:hypothetical protein
MPPLGAEQPTIFSEKAADAMESGAESGAPKADSAILADQGLARIVAVWPSLSDAAKGRIIGIVNAGEQDND